MRSSVTFIINLLQDVNVLRPLAYLAARDLRLPISFLLSHKFLDRDQAGLWQEELREIDAELGAPIAVFHDEFEALQQLEGKNGFLVAGSESNLPAHDTVHNVFRIAPASLTRITLQHGFECVGFRQSRDQDIAHGRGITFAADVVCGWFDAGRMNAMAASQKPKLHVSGPPMALQTRRRVGTAPADAVGFICENLHSPRFKAAGDFKADFMENFTAFCAALAERGEIVVLRPHPGGQYVLKNKVALPANVSLETTPIYKVDLSRFSYGISAPSSVLIDMVLAGIPVAVWHDGAVMDLGNYEGLTVISSVEEWLNFAREASADPEPFLKRQRAFLAGQGMPTDPREVAHRFASLFQTRMVAGEASVGPGQLTRPTTECLASVTPDDSRPAKRILFIANGMIPTLQLSFIKPLRELGDDQHALLMFLTEEHMKEKLGKDLRSTKSQAWVRQKLSEYDPELIVFCRYSGPHADFILSWATAQKVPAFFHIDDDLLNIPRELGEAKFKAHNHPSRLAAVRTLLDKANLVYASTGRLRDRLLQLGAKAPIVTGKIYASGAVIQAAEQRPVRKVGYMGFDHLQDLAMVLPSLVTFLRRNPDVRFELFGSIPKPDELNEFGERIVLVPPVRNYEEFLRAFAQRNWDIGICPLAPTAFNVVKANTKWVEYTSVGAAVVASRDTVYDSCCDDGCGSLAGTNEEWLEALESLVNDPRARFEQVRRAQTKLTREYSTKALSAQVIDVFDLAAFAARQLPKRVLFVAADNVPTLQLSFTKPLKRLIDAGLLRVDLLTVKQLKDRTATGEARHKPHARWLEERFISFDPDLLVFCRYNGPYVELLLDLARARSVATMFHIDDDLLGIPMDLGEEKHLLHNQPAKLDAVRTLLDRVDLVYASTLKLQRRLANARLGAPIVAGAIYASGKCIRPANKRPSCTIGYMASADHAHNLQMILPAIEQLMVRNPDIVFELFGSIPVPESLERFGARIRTAPPVKNYENFLMEFAAREWDVGICPLTPIPFNLMKANTKWVEYTSVGAAVVASRNTVYDECCAEGCGLLAETPDEWLKALEQLVRDPQARYEQVSRAQAKLTRDYSVAMLREQVLSMFDRASALSRQRSNAPAALIDLAKV